eukprot:TRINITY_DN7078_c0_g1_i1.p1 TRINITY_DN7078_c0_g1~~TRINITY_DN7078_c0_g1_i1.p1  ORF type:complete len:394 (-),score=49.90 TRINITY_DN7078_c0_g1_i1:57-1091(-)
MSNGTGLSGWLKKRGDKGVILDLTWKVRFFSQTGPTELSYFKDSKPDAKKKGAIDLGAVVSVNVRNEFPNGFEIITPGRVYILQSYTEAERKMWMENLNTKCPKLPGYAKAQLNNAQQQQRLGPQPQSNIPSRLGNGSPARSESARSLIPQTDIVMGGRSDSEPVYVSLREQNAHLQQVEQRNTVSLTDSRPTTITPNPESEYASFGAMMGSSPASNPAPAPLSSSPAQQAPQPQPQYQPSSQYQPQQHFLLSSSPAQSYPQHNGGMMQVGGASREPTYMRTSDLMAQAQAQRSDSTPAAPASRPVVPLVAERPLTGSFGGSPSYPGLRRDGPEPTYGNFRPGN